MLNIMLNKKIILSLLLTLLVATSVFAETNSVIDEEVITNNKTNRCFGADTRSKILFKIIFEFSERKSWDIDKINDVLSTIPLSYLNIADDEGYLETTNYSDKAGHSFKETTYRYGFDKVSLICVQDNEKERHYYQMNTKFFAKGEIKNFDMLSEFLYKEHPELIISMAYKISRNDGDVFVIIHHEKK